MNRFRSHLAAALQFMLCFSGSQIAAHAPAQTPPRQSLGTLSLTGTVHDPSSAVIVGASVTLHPSGNQRPIATQTDKSGSFTFHNLSAGRYQLEASQAGFGTVSRAVTVSNTPSGPIQIVLPLASVEQQVTVAASDSANQISTEIDQNQSSNTVDRESLDNLPVFDQDYITTLSQFLDPDATGTNGVDLIVNGVAANGPGVTASAISSVKINQNPYSALFARPGRARIEITTEGGTPAFHGSANFLFRDSVFDASNAFAVVKPGEQRTYYEGSLTGPLSHSKKTTFLLSLDQDNDDQQAIVVADTPTGPVNENVPSPAHHYFLSGRVFHDYGKANQFWIGYSYEHGTTGNQGVGGTVLPEAGANTLFFEHEINVGDTRVLSPTLLNQLHFLVGHFDRQTHSINSAPQISVSGAFTGGGAQADARRTEYHFDGTDILTWTHGHQELKFGIDVPDISRRGYDDFTNEQGTYSFADLASYAAAQPFSYLVQRGQGHVTFLERTVAGLFEDNLRLRPNFSLAVGARYYFQNYFHDIAHDLAPRVSFAYAPIPRGKTILRGGAGFFFDRTGPSPISDLLHFNGVRLQRILVLNPSYPATNSQIAAVPTSLVQLDPRLRIPYTIQYSLGIERQFTSKSTLSATYTGTRGIDMFRSIDANAPAPPDYASRPNSAIGQLRQMQSEGYLKSNSLEISLRGKPVKFFAGQAQYTLGKTYNNTSGITWFPADSYAPNADWGRSDNDRRNRFNLLGTFSVHDWFRFGTALALSSGKPVNITTGNDDNHDGLALDRPAGVPRNTLHGPGYTDLDLNLGRDIRLTKSKEGPQLSVALNSFNVLNHVNDVTYIGVVGSPFFGHSVSALPPRRMQLDLQFKF